ncbi:MAG: hypothetical protein KF805_12120 [Phycisphaeraceae bacterium]|nr:hypothetical protein [Phycisphaeraceae bacterium]
MKPESAPSNFRRNITVAASLVAIGVAGFFIVRGLIPKPQTIPGAYFFDLNTKKIFVVPANTRAPVSTPSGPFENEPAGVRLFLFSCKPCPNFDGKTLEEVKALGATVGWIERYTAEAKKLLDAGDRKSETLFEGLQMRAPSGDRWLSPSSREALAIRDTISRLCSGLPGQACNPE